jgi:hypothetical protein
LVDFKGQFGAVVLEAHHARVMIHFDHHALAPRRKVAHLIQGVIRWALAPIS